jgi:hypothetical protein
MANLNESEMARSSECTGYYARKELDTADIVRDDDFSPLEVETLLGQRHRIAPPSRKICDPDLQKNPEREQASVERLSLPPTPHCGRQRVILATISTIPGGRNGPSLCRQDERQYNQRSQQHARYEREHRLQWVRLEMAASLCSPVHRGPHGSLLLADPIIYSKKTWEHLPPRQGCWGDV